MVSLLFGQTRTKSAVEIGEYQGIVRVPRQVLRRFIDGAVTPQRCLETYHLHRTRLELVVERKLRNRQLTDDGNVEINGRDLRAPSRAVRASAGYGELAYRHG